MDGIKLNGITLFIGKIPNRKQQAFYFDDGSRLYPMAYIPEDKLDMTQMLWQKMLDALNKSK